VGGRLAIFCPRGAGSNGGDFESLPAIVQANGVEALLIDTVQFYAELGTMQLGMPEERREIFELLAELETQHTYRPTPEESAAIDEAIRSLEAGKGVPAAEIRQRFAAKWSR